MSLIWATAFHSVTVGSDSFTPIYQLAPYFYVAGLVWAGVLRVVLIGGVVALSSFVGGKHPLKSLRKHWRSLGPRTPDEHTAFLAMYDTDRTLALTVGSLALAAWAVLTAFHPAHISSNSLGLELLFVGVLLAISGPLIFRLEGSDGSEIGLEAIIAIAYLALVYSLADLLVDVFGRPWLSLIGMAAVVILSVRELIEVWAQIGLTWRSIKPPGTSDFSGLATVLTTPAVDSAHRGGTAESFSASLVGRRPGDPAGNAWVTCFAQVERTLKASSKWPWG